MWEELNHHQLNTEIMLLETLFSCEAYSTYPKKRLSVFENLSSSSSRANSEQSISRTSSDASLSSHLEFCHKSVPTLPEKETDFEIGHFTIEPEEKSENIFSPDDFKECLSSAPEESVKKSRMNRRKTKGVKESCKKKKFRKGSDALTSDIANQLFFEVSSKYPLVVAKKMAESVLSQNIKPN